VLGILGGTGHAFRFQRPDEPGYHNFSDVIRNCSAVTAACLMIRRRVFEEVGGFDPRFKVAYNDVDLCLRLRQRGFLIVYTPFAVLYHHESATRGTLQPPEEETLYWRSWGQIVSAGDPYYNPNLTRTREDWTLDLNQHRT
jgi:GT2 family glycosyltransferase